MRQLNRQIDDWFMGYKTRAVSPKYSANLGGSGSLKAPRARSFAATGLKSGTGLKNLKAAAAKKPEVMVKIAKRVSNKSNGMRGVQNHIRYISRNGELPVETKDGERLKGNQAVNSLIKDWQNLGIPDQSKQREALNIVLSMPAGTPPQAVLNAARQFAAEQFERHPYVLALHHESEKDGEPPHPHVHLCVLMRDENGKRLNPRKNDLFEWRVRFAEKLREQGVECAATRRQHRGKTIKGERAELRAIIKRTIEEKAQGKDPTQIRTGHIARQNAESIIQALAEQQRPKHPYQEKAQAARGHIVEQYGMIAKELYKMGYKTEARIISRLAKDVSEQGYDTKAQIQYDKAHALLHQHEPQFKPRQPQSHDRDMER